MSKSFLLHAGMPKTGTTTIQNTLFKCRDMLLTREKCLYPGVAANHTNSICTMFMDNPERHISSRMSGLEPGEKLDQLRRGYFETMRKDMENSDWNLCAISAEGVSNLNQGEIGKIRDWFLDYCDSARVVFYVRNPLDYTRSVIQQLLKGGETLDALFENLPVPNFQGKISNAIRVFGRENVEIVNFHTAVKGDGGLLGSFSHLLGFAPDVRQKLSESEVRDNESMSFAAAHILDYFNTINPIFVDGKLSPLRTGVELATVQKIGGGKFDIPIAMQRKCYEETREDVAWLNEAFGTHFFQDEFSQTGRDTVFASDFVDALHKVAELMSEQLATIAAMRICNEGIKALARRDFVMADAFLERALKLAPSDHFVAEYRLRVTSAKQKAQGSA